MVMSVDKTLTVMMHTKWFVNNYAVVFLHSLTIIHYL